VNRLRAIVPFLLLALGAIALALGAARAREAFGPRGCGTASWPFGCSSSYTLTGPARARLVLARSRGTPYTLTPADRIDNACPEVGIASGTVALGAALVAAAILFGRERTRAPIVRLAERALPSPKVPDPTLRDLRPVLGGGGLILVGMVAAFFVLRPTFALPPPWPYLGCMAGGAGFAALLVGVAAQPFVDAPGPTLRDAVPPVLFGAGFLLLAYGVGCELLQAHAACWGVWLWQGICAEELCTTPPCLAVMATASGVAAGVGLMGAAVRLLRQAPGRPAPRTPRARDLAVPALALALALAATAVSRGPWPYLGALAAGALVSSAVALGAARLVTPARASPPAASPSPPSP
jgi:hypothetical protein